MVSISIAFATADHFATRWDAWEYNPKTTLNKQFSIPPETYILCAILTAIIASATLVLARKVDLEDKKKSKG